MLFFQHNTSNNSHNNIDNNISNNNNNDNNSDNNNNNNNDNNHSDNCLYLSPLNFPPIVLIAFALKSLVLFVRVVFRG